MAAAGKCIFCYLLMIHFEDPSHACVTVISQYNKDMSFSYSVDKINKLKVSERESMVCAPVRKDNP